MFRQLPWQLANIPERGPLRENQPNCRPHFPVAKRETMLDKIDKKSNGNIEAFNASGFADAIIQYLVGWITKRIILGSLTEV